MKKKILVTGGLGFIGSNLIGLLLKKNYQVINIDKISYSSNFYNLLEFKNNKNYKFYKCDLNNVKSCVKITGYVNSNDNFIDQPKVINGASDLLVKIFGENGKHSRAAISVSSLPLGASVEIDAIFEIN